jgi:hypothetical protein
MPVAMKVVLSGRVRCVLALRSRGTLMTEEAMRSITMTVVFSALLGACTDSHDPPPYEFWEPNLEELRACGEPGELIDPINPRFVAMMDAGCERFLGVVGSRPPGSELTVMAPLRRIDVALAITETPITDLHGLEQLESVGALQLSLLPTLVDITALRGLRLVEDEGLRIWDTRALRSLDGLESLERVGQLIITGNTELESLDGLAALRRVDGDVTIHSNARLTREEIDALLARIEVGGRIQLTNVDP